MVRQLLEFDAGGAGRRIGIVGDEIAPPQLGRVHADLRRGEFDQAFGDRGRDRMADGAVLAHDVLVLKHDAGAGAIVRAGVGPADQIDDLVGLDAAGARIDRIRADAGQIVDLERGDGAVVLHADLRLDAMIAGVDVGDEALEPVGDEFDRPPQQLRQRHRRHLVGIGVHLDAERAADVLGEHAHLMLFETEVLGEQVLHHVRRLRALIDGEALLARIPVGDDGARLVGDAGVAAEHEGRLDDRVGFGETFVGIAGDERALEGEIVAELGMDHRRRLVERGFRVGHGGQALRSRPRPARRHPRLSARVRATTAATASPCQQARSTAMACCGADLMPLRWVSTPTHGVITFASSAPVTTATTPGAFSPSAASMFLMRACACGERTNATCAMRGKRDVADILAAPLRQPRQIRPRHRAADIGVRPVEGGEARRLIVGDFHCFTALACATATFDRIDDRLIAGAAAVIAGHVRADRFAAGHAAARQKFLRADQHARRAEAALQRVAALERRLQIGDGAGIRQAFDGLDLGAVALHRENEAAAHDRAVEPHRAGAAHAVLAADMGAGERKIVAQEIDQRLARFDPRGNILAVDAQ